MLQAGPDVLRFAPSLIVTEVDRVEGLARFERARARLNSAGTVHAKHGTDVPQAQLAS